MTRGPAGRSLPNGLSRPDRLGLLDTVGVDRDRLAALLGALAERGWTVATAESLTGGLLAAVLTEIPGSSAVVRGGLVCYATDLKLTLAGVEEAVLRRYGPVHSLVARQLAAGARQRCAATIGIGLTGVAGPDRQDGHPVGTVFVALDGADPSIDREWAQQSDSANVSETGRDAIRGQAIRAALAMLAAAAGTENPRSRTADMQRGGMVGHAE